MNGTGAENLTLKYFTINANETIQEILRRAKFEIRGLSDYEVTAISPLMGRGVRVISLTNVTFTSQVKLEVYEDQVEEVLKRFTKAEIHNKPKLSPRRSDGLDDIGEFFN